MLPLTPSNVLQGYRIGIFPMADPDEDGEIYWYEPDPRGILPLDGLKVSKSLRKTIERGVFEVTVDKAFKEVMRQCAARDKTWITDEIIEVYVSLHKMGWAHSVEVWKDGKLAGGLYGVAINKAFFGESMFHRVTDASKVALYHLVQWLNERGFKLLDTQFTTPHLISLGAIDISSDEYKALLEEAISDN